MNILKSSIIYSFFTSISRIFGFLRDIFIANFLGTGLLADIFFVAFRFPNTFRRIFSEGALNSAFVPIYTKLVNENLTYEAQKFAGNILIIFFLSALFLVVLIEIFMPNFIRLIAPGFSNDASKFEELVRVSRIIFPFLIFISISSIYSSILNSNNKFALSAALPIILNITLILSIIIAFYNSKNYLTFLAWGVVLGGILQVIILYLSLLRAKINISFSFNFLNSYTKRFTNLFSASFFSSGLLQINVLIGTIIASFESGAISYLYYADRIYQLPLALIGIAIGIALLPSISSKIKKENQENINQTIEETLIYALLFSIPASIGIFVLSDQIVSTLFERGEFDQNSTVYTSNALKYYSYGLVAFIIMKIYTPIFFAYENAKPTLYITALNLILNTILGIILFMSMGFVGIAIATSLSAWISVILLHFNLKRNNYFKMSSKMIKPIVVIITASFLMYLYLYNVSKYISEISDFSQYNEIISLVFSVISSILLYLILISFYKPFKYSEIKNILKK